MVGGVMIRAPKRIRLCHCAGKQTPLRCSRSYRRTRRRRCRTSTRLCTGVAWLPQFDSANHNVPERPNDKTADCGACRPCRLWIPEGDERAIIQDDPLALHVEIAAL